MTGVDWALKFERKLQSRLGINGKVFSVNPSGGADCVSSQEAIDACVDNRGDVVLRHPGGEEVTETVAFNKKGISYMAMPFGVAPGALGELFSIYSAAAFTDGPAATITKRCYIEGIAFVSRDTGSQYYSGAAALIGGMSDANPFGTWLHKCRFPKWGLDNRIGLAIEGSSDVRVSECTFEGVGSDLAIGIYVQGAVANLDILDNLFRDCTYGILTGSFAAGPEAVIKGNVFHASKALNVGTTAPMLFADNWLCLATDSASYSDTVDNLNALGVIFTGNHYPE